MENNTMFFQAFDLIEEINEKGLISKEVLDKYPLVAIFMKQKKEKSFVSKVNNNGDYILLWNGDILSRKKSYEPLQRGGKTYEKVMEEFEQGFCSEIEPIKGFEGLYGYSRKFNQIYTYKMHKFINKTDNNEYSLWKNRKSTVIQIKNGKVVFKGE